MKDVYVAISGIIVVGTAVPYFLDVLKGKVRPLRSTRLMFFLLIVLAYLQQRDLQVGLTMVITVSELIVSSLLFITSMKKGVGGYEKLDIACYTLLTLSVLLWYTTKSAYVGLLFTILADFVAFFPVIYRTAKDPRSETQLFYWGGVLGPVIAIVADPDKSVKNIIFVAYLAGVNMLVALLINRQYFIVKEKVRL